ncbi:MAG: hypothetical protein ABIJ65_02380 [Chloroflexota bacterium]
MTQDSSSIGGDEKIPRKGNWYLLTGLVIGILSGLIISWVVAPVKYIDTHPATLRSDFKDDFRFQIASAFYATNNLERAKSRLDLLDDADVIQALTKQAQNLLDSGDPTNKAFVLAFLTSALKQDSDLSLDDPTENKSLASTNTATTNPTGTSPVTMGGTPSKQPAFINTPTLRPSSTFTPTLGAAFILKKNQVICDSPQNSLLLQVEIRNRAGKPIPGAEIIITWSEGEEHFFTGLKPEIGDGYADYLMTPEVVYSIQLAKGGAPVSYLSAPSCSTESGITRWGSIKLVFQQP